MYTMEMIKLIRERSPAPAGLQLSWTASCMTMLWQVNWQLLAVWSGSPSCSEGQCVPDVTLSTCQRDVFMASIPRYEYIHSYWTYILVYTSIYTNIHGFKHRTLWLLFRRTLTALRRIVMLFRWKTVGMHVRSSSSSAICVLNMEDSPGAVYTKLVQVYTTIYLYMHVYHSIYSF